MPRILIFAPCEKVLVDQATNSISLIGVLQEFHYKVPPRQPAPSQNVSLPMNWSVLSLWQEEPSDAGIQYEQKILLENEAGTSLMENVTSWKFTATSHRIIAKIAGLPVSRKLDLHLFYRIAVTGDWTRAATYPIFLMRDVL